MTSEAQGETHLPEQILLAAGRLLAERPFAASQLFDVASAAGLSLDVVRSLFPRMTDLGNAILDHERASMHLVQRRVSAIARPSERVIAAFRLVGENLADDVLVRAGVRIAGESRAMFPSRRLDPFKTWETFIRTQLEAERASGARLAIDIEQATRLLVAAGMGAKELVAFSGDWRAAPAALETTASDLLNLIVERK